MPCDPGNPISPRWQRLGLREKKKTEHLREVGRGLYVRGGISVTPCACGDSSPGVTWEVGITLGLPHVCGTVIPLLGGIEDGISPWLCVSPAPGCSGVVAGDWVVTEGQDGGRGMVAGGRWHWGIPPAGKRELITPGGGERGPLILPRWVPPSRCLSSLMGSWLSPPSPPPPPGLSTPLPAHPPAQQAPPNPGARVGASLFSYEAGFRWAPQGEPPASGWASGPPKVLRVPDVWV